jgi:hypothetical protein
MALVIAEDDLHQAIKHGLGALWGNEVESERKNVSALAAVMVLIPRWVEESRVDSFSRGVCAALEITNIFRASKEPGDPRHEL